LETTSQRHPYCRTEKCQLLPFPAPCSLLRRTPVLEHTVSTNVLHKLFKLNFGPNHYLGADEGARLTFLFVPFSLSSICASSAERLFGVGGRAGGGGGGAGSGIDDRGMGASLVIEGRIVVAAAGIEDAGVGTGAGAGLGATHVEKSEALERLQALKVQPWARA
jgi:hypothetical protein